LIRCLGREVLIKQILRHWVARIPLRRDSKAPLWTASETGQSHQSGDFVPAVMVAFVPQIFGDLGTAIDPFTLSMQASDDAG
jgi:hypothetical protein